MKVTKLTVEADGCDGQPLGLAYEFKPSDNPESVLKLMLAMLSSADGEAVEEKKSTFRVVG
jgi:hypothetical protein